MRERRREPRLSWNCTAPPSETIQRPKVSGLGVMVAFCVRTSVSWLAGSQPVRAAGSRPQGPVGHVSRGLGARAPRAWGPAHQPFPHKNHPNLSNYDFFANLLVGAWRRRGCRLKRLLRRWGPGGKRSRDTPPTPPPPTPPPRFGSPSNPPLWSLD